MRLADVLQAEFADIGTAEALAVTMTGEMADCFIDRHEGVRQIAEACRLSSSKCGIGRTGFYGSHGQFLDFDEVENKADFVASANWHASASWLASEFAIDEGIMIDIGSTTTDLIPIKDAEVWTNAKTDHQRLCEGSLTYVGCGRTPVCSLVSSLRINGKDCLVMNEVFATIDDAMIVLGMTPPDATDLQSADGQPRTPSMAANRIARMVGLDRKFVSMEIAEQLAIQVINAAKNQIKESFRLIDRGGTIILGGHCDALLDLPRGRTVIRLSERFDAQHSRCLPALAVARLFESWAQSGAAEPS